MRSKLASTVLIVLVLAWAFSSLAGETQKAFCVRFSPEALSTEQTYLEESPFDLLRMEDLDMTADPGEPTLPVRAVHIYIPRDKEVAAISVEITKQSSLPGRYLIFPAQPEIPLSSVVPPGVVPPDKRIYSLSETYPASPVVLASSGSMGGRQVAGFQVFPLQYVPAEGRVVFNEEITFMVHLVDRDQRMPVPKETPKVRNLRNRLVRGLVNNPDDLEKDFPPEAADLDPSVAAEYLIISHPNHADEYQLLRDWKTRKGVPTAIVTTDSALANYPGRDDQERLRNCIMDYYLNRSTLWVAMTMTAPKAKIRGCYGSVGGTVDPAIPCDLYFSDMDGDWNADGDSNWGETTDDVDLYPDVYVGRLTANTGVACSTMVHKILTYEGCYPVPTDYQLDMLFMAEYLDDYTDAALIKNLIDSESVPSRFDPITKLYQSSGNLDKTAAMAALNAGYNLVNHAGHGNINLLSIGEDMLTDNDMEVLTNAPRYSVFYTLACDPAAFDNLTGCLGKAFTEAVDGGGFFIGNSRVSWYASGSPGQGTGDRYDREFFKSIFVRGYTHLGVAHADAKVQRIPYSGGYGTNRWQQFTLNLFGDPETYIWVDLPVELSASHPDTIQTGSQLFVVSVTSGGSPLSQATACLWKGDEIYLVDETDEAGEAGFSISPADSGTMLVTVVKDGYLPYQGSCSVRVFDGLTRAVEISPTPHLSIKPNPASGPVKIFYSLPGAVSGRSSDTACLTIYDASGRQLTAVEVPQGAANGGLTWNARLQGGAPAPSGIYFAQLRARGYSTAAKFVIVH
jgi:hypothetical protein